MKKFLIIWALVHSAFACFGQSEGTPDGLNSNPVESTAKEALVMIPLSEDISADSAGGLFSSEEFLIYPTRTSNIFNVIRTSENKKSYIGRLMDASGRMVKLIELDALHTEVSLKSLETGNYLFRITSGDKPVSEISIVRESSAEN